MSYQAVKRWSLEWSLVITLLGGVVNTASGGLLDHGPITFDTTTGRQWLDLSQSTGLSYNDMKQQFGCDPVCTSGKFAGWTFAQAGDVKVLVEHGGVPYGKGDLLGYPDPAIVPNINALISLLGGTLSPGGTPFPDCPDLCGAVTGIVNRVLTADDLAGNPIYPADQFAGFIEQASIANISCCDDLWAGDNLTGAFAGMLPYPVAPISPSTPTGNGGDIFFTGGVWLYRAPEPATLLLFATSLAISLMSLRIGHRRVPCCSGNSS